MPNGLIHWALLLHLGLHQLSLFHRIAVPLQTTCIPFNGEQL